MQISSSELLAMSAKGATAIERGATCIVSAPGRDPFELPIEMVDDGFVILGDDRCYHVTPAGLTQALHGTLFPE